MNARGFMFARHQAKAHLRPYQDYAQQFRRAIVVAVLTAWERLVAQGVECHNENEATAVLTEELEEILSAGVDVPLFNRQIFQNIVRDAAYVNYNGELLQKRPDLVIRLANCIDHHDAWFIEAKIVDATHLVRKYVDEGIDRFVKGDYAWAMPTAMMLGYAGASFTPEATLNPRLTPPAERAAEYLGVADVWKSVHGRPWKYVGTGGDAPDITLCHLWLHGMRFTAI